MPAQAAAASQAGSKPASLKRCISLAVMGLMSTNTRVTSRYVCDCKSDFPLVYHEQTSMSLVLIFCKEGTDWSRPQIAIRQALIPAQAMPPPPAPLSPQFCLKGNWETHELLACHASRHSILFQQANLVTGGGYCMGAATPILVLAPRNGPQLGAQGPQVGVLHLLRLALLGIDCCHSCCQVVIVL